MSTLTQNELDKLWPLPEGSDETRRAARIVRSYLVAHDATDHGGGGKLYSPKEWAERGERYGRNALVIITHDGGDHAHLFNWDYQAYESMEDLMAHLKENGLWMEQCTSWYTAIYAL